jgi:uncharacterized protein (DUF697 family)
MVDDVADHSHNHMDAHKLAEHEGESALALVKWLSDHAIDGVRPLSSAQDLATEYLRDQSYRSHRQRIDALIKWETTKNFTSGFVTGLGGLLTLPLALPAGFAASWVIQARMAAAIARIYGHDLRSERMRTLIVATLVGDSVAEIATASGIRVGSGIAKAVADRVSRRGFIEFSRRVGSRLLRMAGEKSSVNLMKGVPLIGGIAGGTVDAVGCRIVGKHARKLFETAENSGAPKKRVPRRAASPRARAAAGEPTKNRRAKASSAKKSAGTKSSAKKSSAKKAAGARKSSGSNRSSGAKKSTATSKRR